VLPRIVSSSDVLARGRNELDGVPLGGILGDQQAALVGRPASHRRGEKYLWTGCFLLLNNGDDTGDVDQWIADHGAYRFGDAPACYALEGSVAITGALVQWLRDNLGLIKTSAEVEALASSVTDNGNVYFVPAFSGLYAPYWRADARGVIAGLTRFATGGSHRARGAGGDGVSGGGCAGGDGA